MAQMYEVASLDEANCSRKKVDKMKECGAQWKTFHYDNETAPGIIQHFYDLKNIVNGSDGIVQKVSEMKSQYNDLKGKYEEFTNYNETMDSYIRTAETVADVCNMRIEKIIKAVYDIVVKAAEEDKTLLDDVEALKDLLGMESDEGVGGTFMSGN